MGDTEDLLAWLRQKHQEMPDPEAGSFYSIAADELMRLEGGLAEADTYIDLAYADATRAEDEAAYWKARAERAEADAGRLAESIRWVADHPDGSADCPLRALLAHDREVEAR